MTGPEATTEFDLIVIGAGPGGYVAAIRAAQLGLRTVSIEKDAALGGTCLNVGCIPSKALLDSTEHFAYSRDHFAEHGIRATIELDLATMMKRKLGVVRDLTRGIAGLFQKNGVTSIRGTARISAPGQVEVEAEGALKQTLRSRHLLIATGSEPAGIPGLPFDGRRVIDSTAALELSVVPRGLLVIGAGAIGLELGSVWRRLGSDVTVLELTDGLLPGVDRDTAKVLQRSLERQGVKFRFGVSVNSAKAEGAETVVRMTAAEGPAEERGEVVLVAVGRKPFTTGLGLEAIGLAPDARGRIAVDQHYRTAVPGVWAIGDVIAGPMLAHKAEEEGIAAVERIAGLPGHVAYECVPSVVYTWPEVATVGLGEDAARAEGREVSVGVFPFLANGRARAMQEREGQVKLVADARTDRLLGAQLVGPRASELIAELVVAMELQASAEDVARTVHAHPTLSEAVKEAALGVAGRRIHI